MDARAGSSQEAYPRTSNIATSSATVMAALLSAATSSENPRRTGREAPPSAAHRPHRAFVVVPRVLAAEKTRSTSTLGTAGRAGLDSRPGLHARARCHASAGESRDSCSNFSSRSVNLTDAVRTVMRAAPTQPLFRRSLTGPRLREMVTSMPGGGQGGALVGSWTSSWRHSGWKVVAVSSGARHPGGEAVDSTFGERPERREAVTANFRDASLRPFMAGTTSFLPHRRVT